jgi:hypothetical protein
MKLYRQGDLLFKQIEKFPFGKEDAVKRENGHILEGETTGHIHKIADLEAAEVLEVGESMYLNVTAEGGVSIVHEDHKEVVLPEGNYEIVRQREYDPEKNRQVAD